MDRPTHRGPGSDPGPGPGVRSQRIVRVPATPDVPAGRILKGDELRSRLNSPRYIAALEDNIAGHIHPLNYTLGLAKAAQAAGAKLFSQTRVTKVEPGKIITGTRVTRDGSTHEVETTDIIDGV